MLGSFIRQMPACTCCMDVVVFVHGSPRLDRLPQGRDVQVVALDVKASLALAAAGVEHKTVNNYPVPDSCARAVDFLNRWSCTPVMDGRTIKELLVHDGFSFWWCMEQWLFYSFLYRNPVSAIIESVDIARAVLDIERPKSIVYFDDGTLYSKVIPLLALKAGVKVVRISNSRPLLLRVKEALRPWGISQFLRWHSRARRMIWAFERWRAGYCLPEKKGRHVLAVCSYHWRTVEHPALDKPVLGDHYITPVLEQLKDATVTYVDETLREYVGFSALKQKARSRQRHVLVEQYASRHVFRRVKSTVRALRRVARSLEKSPAFINSWNFEGVDLWPLVAPQFRAYFSYRLENHVLQYECAKALLLREKPDVVVYPCEAGDHAYAFFSLASKLGIPSVGIQHGTMSYSPLTVHLQEEMRGSLCVPRPTRLLVYGSYHRDFLAKNSVYPVDGISIIGNVRFDHFAGVRKLSKQAMMEKYGLDASRPAVMYLTQILPLPQESEQITRSVFMAVKELGLPLIVKQHPGEQSDVLYHRLAQEIGIKPLITKNASTLELLTASDVLIGAESTLDYEAMILDKPVIVVNFGGRRDSLPFVEEGAALGVYTPEDVLPALKKALFDEKTRSVLAERMRALVQAHCYLIDGKAAARAAEIIEELAG